MIKQLFLVGLANAGGFTLIISCLVDLAGEAFGLCSKFNAFAKEEDPLKIKELERNILDLVLVLGRFAIDAKIKDLNDLWIFARSGRIVDPMLLGTFTRGAELRSLEDLRIFTKRAIIVDPEDLREFARGTLGTNQKLLLKFAKKIRNI